MLKTYIIKSENIPPGKQRGTTVALCVCVCFGFLFFFFFSVFFKKVGNRKGQADNTNSETLLTVK